MANTVTTKYYGVEGTGRTLTEARQDAGRKIEKILSGEWYPIIRTESIYGLQYVTIICRDNQGWNYAFFPTGGKDDRHWTTGVWPTEEEVMTKMYRHLAQYVMHPKMGLWGLEVIRKNDHEGRSEHRSYCQWQFRCLYFLNVGLNGDAAHTRASESAYDGTFDKSLYPEEIR